MSNGRTDISIVLDIRSYERVVLISKNQVRQYPESWVRPNSLSEMLLLVSADSVVIVDGTDVTRRAYGEISRRQPRIVALTARDETQARSARRLLSSVQPWCELYSVGSSLGRVVFATGFHGEAYDRERVVDTREAAEA